MGLQNIVSVLIFATGAKRADELVDCQWLATPWWGCFVLSYVTNICASCLGGVVASERVEALGPATFDELAERLSLDLSSVTLQHQKTLPHLC